MQVLATSPHEAVDGVALIHNQLAAVYSHSANHLGLAIEHLHEAMCCYEATGNQYMAGGVRNNLAWMLLRAGRLAEARDFAQSAPAFLNACSIPAPELIRYAESCLKAAEEGLGV
jgi:hypothetical protein